MNKEQFDELMKRFDKVDGRFEQMDKEIREIREGMSKQAATLERIDERTGNMKETLGKTATTEGVEKAVSLSESGLKTWIITTGISAAVLAVGVASLIANVMLKSMGKGG